MSEEYYVRILEIWIYKRQFYGLCQHDVSFAGPHPFVYADGCVRGMRDIDSGTGSGLQFALTGSGIGHWPSLV